MSIGSFLATAGRVGQGIRAEQGAMRQDRAQQLALEELNRQDEFRRQQLTAPTAELPSQGLMLGAPMQVAEPEFTPAGSSGVAGLAGAPAVAGVGAVPPPPAAAVPTPATPKAPTTSPFKIAGVPIKPWYKTPDRLDDGVAGFEKIDPNASDIQKSMLRRTNEAKLNKALGGLVGSTYSYFSSFRKQYATQSDKRKMELGNAAASWYQSAGAKDYFRRNPEMLAVAQKDPANFFDSLNKTNKFFREAQAKTPKAAPAGAAPTAAPAGPLAGIITQIRQAETGGLANPYVSNLTGASSAFGPYQFTRGTWIGTYRALNPDTVLSDDKIWARRTNPELNERLMQKLTADNAAYLERSGMPVNAPTAYLAHFLNPKSAVKLLQADANTPVESLLSKKQVDANPTVLKGKTVGQVVQWAVTKTSGGAQPTGTQVAAGVNTGATPMAAPRRIDPSSFYLADQNMISQDMRVALQNRTELTRMAQMYRNAGMGDQFTQARLKMLDLDNSLLFLQGMQGIQEIALANDPRRLAAVWSQYAGVPVQLQPQTDGTYNVTVNGRVTQRGVASNTIIDSARSAFDAEYRKMRTESSSSMAIEQFKTQLRISEESAKAVLQTAREAQNELIRGDNARAIEMIKQLDPNGKITMLPDGSGRSILQVQGQTIMLDPGGSPIEGAPEGVLSGPSGRPIAGLPARSVGVGVGG